MKRLTGASVLALSAMAAPALADVTPQQVWGDFQAYMESFGYSVEATQATSGDTLTVSDVTMAMTLPDNEGDLSFSMTQVMFTDRGDGTVAVVFPAVMPIAVRVDAEGEAVDLVIDYTHDGLEMIVAGSEDDMQYTYTANALALTLSSMIVEGDVIPPEMARFGVTMGPVDGMSNMQTTNGTRVMTQQMALGNVAYTFAANDENGEEGGLFDGTLSGVVIKGDTTIPQDVDFSDAVALMQAGLSGSADIRHDGGRMEFSVTERQGTTSGQTSSSGGYTEMAFSGDAFSYAFGGEGIAFALAGPEIPLPISAEMDEASLSLALPLAKSTEPTDAAFAMTLGGFSMSEMLWNVFDPGAVLSRDPATVSFDIKALVTPFVSLFDEAALAALGNNPPGALNAMTLENLRVEAAGGLLTGDGAFTFDNTDLDSFDGLPRPEGTLNLSVAGANGLIDGLIQMGLLQESDAMGARMMMGMFTVPGTAPDTATSTITVNPAGHVLANGQRIR